MDNKKVGFYCQLPKATVKEIKRRAKGMEVPQWYVIASALAPRSAPSQLDPERVKKLWKETVGVFERNEDLWGSFKLRTGGPRRKARGAK